MPDPVSWLLNKGTKEKDVVDAPAFSLTKVLTVGAPVVTIAVTLIARWVDEANFALAPVHFTVLVVAVLGLVAIAGAADVIARGLATAAARPPARVVHFANPIQALRFMDGPDDAVTVLAVSCEEPPRYLCMKPDGSMRWEAENDLKLSAERLPAAAVSGNGRPKAAKKS